MTNYHPLPDNRKSLKKSRRIILIDIMILFIIGAILYPLMIAHTSNRVVDGYRIKQKTRLLGDEVRILVEITPTSEAEQAGRPFELQILDSGQNVLDSRNDILPDTETRRIIGFTLPYNEDDPPSDCRFIVGEETAILPVPYPPVPNRFTLPDFLKSLIGGKES